MSRALTDRSRHTQTTFSSKSFEELSRDRVEQHMSERRALAPSKTARFRPVRSKLVESTAARNAQMQAAAAGLSDTVRRVMTVRRTMLVIAAVACATLAGAASATCAASSMSSPPQPLVIDDFGAGERLRTYNVAVQDRDGDARVYVAVLIDASSLTLNLETDSGETVMSRPFENDDGLWHVDLTLTREQLAAASKLSLESEHDIDSNEMNGVYSDLRTRLMGDWNA